ncbi:FAD-dependent oxidoreductase [Flagellimonas pacifica]|uniref:Tryptophan 2-monooxygenase n=1 Tax=Flagellimonas pacifica TaxID=1247520 RepID=A0A285MU16_9FLAO|nr:FAD-dependent oxidoreductase [Allomuricauda parva]SNZ00027.1 NAD(P)-binding Rossmann-like domain-containing protein [Allomuricauda parva]
MKREEFIKICGLFGIGLPLQHGLMACTTDDNTTQPFKGKVLIIGAGAGGLSAGYFLNQQGIDFEILEASAVYGGRMRINTDFADFPIPLGAEWLETNPRIFKEIVNDPSVQVNVETVSDAPDRKFVNYSWFNFFEDYIVPSVSEKISYNTVVQSIDYSGDQVLVNTQGGQRTADKVVISVPLQILKDGDVRFTPNLPQSKLNAINNTVVWEGFKAFFEFSTNFYGDDEHQFQIEPETDGQKIYYNATLGQNTTKNILGLFVVGKPAQDYISRTGEDLKNFILNELDSIYEGKATSSYINHISQNWNNEPFIKGGYMTDHADWRTVQELGKPIGNKLYFAGGAYTDGEDWVSVHTAAQSAKSAIEAINDK